MGDPPRPPSDVLAFYEEGTEEGRLESPAGVLEFTRTKELIRRFLTEPGSVIDIGGGSGRYAQWLADEDHTVTLVEPVAELRSLAQARVGRPSRVAVHAADARALPFEDDAFDAALLLGPLYHLPERSQRNQALGEVTRVCRPGAVVFAAAISRFAPVVRAVIDHPERITDPRHFELMLDEVTSGRRAPQPRRLTPFPDAYFHRPEELRDELAEAGIQDVKIFGIEGPGILLANLSDLWGDEAARQRILTIARAVETDPAFLAVSAHLLGVGRTP